MAQSPKAFQRMRNIHVCVSIFAHPFVCAHSNDKKHVGVTMADIYHIYIINLKNMFETLGNPKQ